MGTLPLRFDGRHANLRVEGPAGAKTVLFLHPFPLDGSCWTGFLGRCARAGLRGAAFDAPGFGQSAASGRPLTMDDLARLAAAALDALGAKTATLAGCSMGGYAMFAFQRLFPERLAAAALLCTKASADSEEGKRKREEQARAALAQGPEAVTSGLLPKLVSSTDALERARDLARGATAQGIADALRGMALRPDSTPDLTRWRVPAVVVAGKDDQVIPAAETDAMARGIPGAGHVVVENAGHLAFLEKPDEVWAAIQAVLARIDHPAPRR